jgi:hypothetical protein
MAVVVVVVVLVVMMMMMMMMMMTMLLTTTLSMLPSYPVQVAGRWGLTVLVPIIAGGAVAYSIKTLVNATEGADPSSLHFEFSYLNFNYYLLNIMAVGADGAGADHRRRRRRLLHQDPGASR